jgi:SWI/SNF-related matrix-associated actin-dependent regulator 1 of chromatin subfamily A
MMELPWTQADCEQCEARCHRMGQPSNVRATYLEKTHWINGFMISFRERKKAIGEITGV